MARQEQLYAGPLALNGDEPVFGEVWHSEGTAVAYLRPQNTIGGVMHDASVELVDGQMVAVGTVDGEPAIWRAVVPERVHSTYSRTSVVLADGTDVPNAYITVSNHKTRIEAPSLSEPVDYAGATVRTLGGRSAAIDLPDGMRLAVTLPKRGCGCGGA